MEKPVIFIPRLVGARQVAIHNEPRPMSKSGGILHNAVDTTMQLNGDMEPGYKKTYEDNGSLLTWPKHGPCSHTRTQA